MNLKKMASSARKKEPNPDAFSPPHKLHCLWMEKKVKRYLKFWGTRGSCPVSGKEYAKFGGNTVCLELLYDETRLIFDAGTGIRNLGESLQGEKKTIHLFLSHAHLDHVIGFPFFAPIYDQNTEIYVWSPEENQKTCRELFHDLMNAAFFPIRLEQLQAKMHFEALDEKRTIEIGPLTLSLCKTDHPSLAYAFKIKTPHQTI
ncbi:MAG: MBL fold metallo-hydrolase, partial [Chlamydiae bacterium]|nr:MBL fold metallo-hydrolase [Chlamydiota bacterium]